MQEEKILTLKQVVARVDLTPARIYMRIKAGTFPAGTKYGMARMWTEAEIDEWLAQRNAHTAA